MDVYDKLYCKMLGITNPYHSFPHRIRRDLPMFDSRAYELNPKHRFVYDKLFIAQSQHIPSGTFHDLDGTYPIFIKPRWGHKTASSKDCYKITSYKDLEPHLKKKNMMWSSFIDAKEGMTDFIIVNGHIVYQLTYEYSEKQYGFADVWKYISHENTPPSEIVEWVEKHMYGYTGPLNVQYRDTFIIEVGLRFGRSGMYIESTKHKVLIDGINSMWETKTWDVRETITFEPFYSFKCWSSSPVLCLIPQHILDALLRYYGAMDFYEYYFEPTGNTSTVFFQFLHTNIEMGMTLKVIIEWVEWCINTLFKGVIALILIGLILDFPVRSFLYTFIALTILSLDNSLFVLKQQVINQKQLFS